MSTLAPLLCSQYSCPLFEVTQLVYCLSSLSSQSHTFLNRLSIYPQKYRNCHVQVLHMLSEGQWYLLLEPLQGHLIPVAFVTDSCGPSQTTNIPIASHHLRGSWYLDDNVEIPLGIQVLNHLPWTKWSSNSKGSTQRLALWIPSSTKGRSFFPWPTWVKPQTLKY